MNIRIRERLGHVSNRGRGGNRHADARGAGSSAGAPCSGSIRTARLGSWR